jgi:predicted ATPase with chaperone activity
MNMSPTENFTSPAATAASPLPAAPLSLADTGLPQQLLVELAAKILLLQGQSRLAEITQRLKLPAKVIEELLEFMRSQRLVELARRGTTHGDVAYALTDAGRERAGEYLRKCRYAGAAPVSLESYVRQTGQQGLAKMRVTRADVERAFDDLILHPELRDQIGAAMNSGRSIFLYGPPGSGKTYLAESLVKLLCGAVAVPYAFTVDGEVVQVFDPLIHQPLPEEGGGAALDGRQRHDQRWVLCRRPVVIAGGELRPEMLDLQFDRTSGYYQAPPQVKANNGLFLIDDLGRQLITPEQLMNRWIVPMDRRRDYLVLHTGSSFTVPFDVVLVFATNLSPADVADEAFLRRLGYKIHVGPVGDGHYRDIFRQACAALGLPYSDAAAAELLELHKRHNRPTLACYPRDLLGLVRDLSVYQGCEPYVDGEALRFAWHNYFALRPEASG